MHSNNQKHYYIVYFSSAITKFSDDELKTLLQKSRINNTRSDITGMLMYYDGNFAQVLEGKYEEVKALYDIIAQDKRHRNIIKMKDGYQDKRVFPEWSMAFHLLKTENFYHESGFKEFVYNKVFDQSDVDEKNPICIVLKTFFECQPVYRRINSY